MRESIESLLDQLRVICNSDVQETINEALSELRNLRAAQERVAQLEDDVIRLRYNNTL